MTQRFRYENTYFGSQDLAFMRQDGRSPGLVFLPGFKSDMLGSKAEAVAEWAEQTGHACLRFDYFGHGDSSGKFEAGTLSGWREEVACLLDQLTSGPQILIGSSFGGFMATLAALDRPDRVAALVLIAPAFDMTERLMRASLTTENRRDLQELGYYLHGSAYEEEGYAITQTLLDDGAQHCILDRPITLNIPIRILHGQLDDAVPWELSLAFAAQCQSSDIEMHFFKSGDHRLSDPHQIDLLQQTIATLCSHLTAQD